MSKKELWKTPIGYAVDDLSVFFASLFYFVWNFRNSIFFEGNVNLVDHVRIFNRSVEEFVC